jgi:hypothetical protein
MNELMPQKVIALDGEHEQDEQLKKVEYKEIIKYQTVIEELKKRLYEIYVIFLDCESVNLMTLYLIFLHHELFAKSMLSKSSLEDIYKSKGSITKKGHDIRFILTLVDDLEDERRSIIEDDCTAIEDIAPKMREIKFYPNLRYNFSTECLSGQIEDIVLCDLETKRDAINKMRTRILQKFPGEIFHDCKH